jgi:hypothetical protein
MGRVGFASVFFLLLGVLFVTASPSAPPADAVARLKHTEPLLDVLHTLRPSFLSGDFDADGRADVVLHVRDHVTGKVGIAIEHSSTHEWFVAGAGHRMGSGDDDFDWMDSWKVVKNSVTHKGDAVCTEKSESASGLVYWSGHDYRWFQQGD